MVQLSGSNSRILLTGRTALPLVPAGMLLLFPFALVFLLHFSDLGQEAKLT